jgi:two-component system KDP operon response regulator KdpE
MLRRVLIIDDDPGLLTLLQIGLERHCFEVITAQSGEQGLREAYSKHPDVVILDIMMPTMDGWDVCRRLRVVSDIPIVMLSAKSSTHDIVKGLSLGADDYIVKPCKLEELEARLLKALERPSGVSANNMDIAYDDGSLYINPKEDTVIRNGKHVDLTPTESRLLGYLVSQRGRIVPHRELLMKVWGPEYADEINCLSVYIRYLRQKIESDPSNPKHILTKHRVGYCFDTPALAS